MRNSGNMEVGRWNGQFNTSSFEIGPYGRFEIGQGIGSFALVECDAPAVQIVADRSRVRVNLGGCQPLNGHQVFIRNPYAHTIKGAYLMDQPIAFGAKPQVNDPSFEFVQRSNANFYLAGTENEKTGMVIMAEKGDHYISLVGQFGMKVLFLADAKPEYENLLPDGMLPTTIEPTFMDGSRNDNLSVRAGYYSNAGMAQWATDCGWNKSPLTVNRAISVFEGLVPQGSAIFASYNPNMPFLCNAKILDQGSWEPEWK